MTSIAALRRSIDQMLEKLDPARLPKTWLVIQESGLDIPDRLYPLLAPFDQIVIHEIPKGYLGPDMSEPVFYSF